MWLTALTLFISVKHVWRAVCRRSVLTWPTAHSNQWETEREVSWKIRAFRKSISRGKNLKLISTYGLQCRTPVFYLRRPNSNYAASVTPKDCSVCFDLVFPGVFLCWFLVFLFLFPDCVVLDSRCVSFFHDWAVYLRIVPFRVLSSTVKWHSLSEFVPICRRLEWYVEGFLVLANQMSWHDTTLGACFQLGLDDKTICCALKSTGRSALKCAETRWDCQPLGNWHHRPLHS